MYGVFGECTVGLHFNIRVFLRTKVAAETISSTSTKTFMKNNIFTRHSQPIVAYRVSKNTCVKVSLNKILKPRLPLMLLKRIVKMVNDE